MGKSATLTTAVSTKVAAGAAHDLRNLLFVVSAHAHRLQAAADPGHPWLEDLHSIQEAADRCSELAAQIVAEARILDQPARPLDLGTPSSRVSSRSSRSWSATASTSRRRSRRTSGR